MTMTVNRLLAQEDVCQPQNIHPAPRLFLRLQKNSNFTTDSHNLGALKYEETKPTFHPRFAPKHATPQPLATWDCLLGHVWF